MPRVLLCALLLVLAVPARASQDAHFAVLRDGRPIGHHRVEVQRHGDETQVNVSIALDVSFGFLPLYSYRHQSTEIWRGDLLQRLDSRTDDNGDKMTVTAIATPDGLRVQGPGGAAVLPADTVPTSYWNPVLVAERPLMDSQNGRLLDIDRVAVGPGRWRLEGELNLDIAYGPGGIWSGLWFRHLGSDFAYQPLPQNSGAP